MSWLRASTPLCVLAIVHSATANPYAFALPQPYAAPSESQGSWQQASSLGSNQAWNQPSASAFSQTPDNAGSGEGSDWRSQFMSPTQRQYVPSAYSQSQPSSTGGWQAPQNNNGGLTFQDSQHTNNMFSQPQQQTWESGGWDSNSNGNGNQWQSAGSGAGGNQVGWDQYQGWDQSQQQQQQHQQPWTQGLTTSVFHPQGQPIGAVSPGASGQSASIGGEYMDPMAQQEAAAALGLADGKRKPPSPAVWVAVAVSAACLAALVALFVGKVMRKRSVGNGRRARRATIGGGSIKGEKMHGRRLSRAMSGSRDWNRESVDLEFGDFADDGFGDMDIENEKHIRVPTGYDTATSLSDFDEDEDAEGLGDYDLDARHAALAARIPSHVVSRQEDENLQRRARQSTASAAAIIAAHRAKRNSLQVRTGQQQQLGGQLKRHSTAPSTRNRNSMLGASGNGPQGRPDNPFSNVLQAAKAAASKNLSLNSVLAHRPKHSSKLAISQSMLEEGDHSDGNHGIDMNTDNVGGSTFATFDARQPRRNSVQALKRMSAVMESAEHQQQLRQGRPVSFVSPSSYQQQQHHAQHQQQQPVPFHRRNSSGGNQKQTLSLPPVPAARETGELTEEERRLTATLGKFLRKQPSFARVAAYEAEQAEEELSANRRDSMPLPPTLRESASEQKKASMQEMFSDLENRVRDSVMTDFDFDYTDVRRFRPSIVF